MLPDKNTVAAQSKPEPTIQDVYPVSHLVIEDNYEEFVETLRLAKRGASILFKGDEAAQKRAIARDMNETGTKFGQKPLHFINGVAPNAYKIAKLILENGGEINAADNDGNLPVHVAIKDFDSIMERAKSLSDSDLVILKSRVFPVALPVLDLYASFGADFCRANNEGKTAMHTLITAVSREELSTQCANLCLPHLQKAVNEYYASQNSVAVQVQQQPPERAPSPVQELKASAKHAGKIAKERACPANTNKKACCIVM